MSSIQEVRDGFIRVYEDIMRAKGLPTIMGRIMAVLLLEGRELNHKEISRWRRKEALRRTMERRPEFLSLNNLSSEDHELLREIKEEVS